MATVISGTKQECDKQAANLIRDGILKILQKKEVAVLGLVGGRSVSGILAELKRKPIPWCRVQIFMVDERMVPIADKESNFHLIYNALTAELNKTGVLPKENLHPFDLKTGILAYEKKLKEYGGKYDLVLLSSGEDGHVGALFPRHHSVKDQSPFFIAMEDSPKLPKGRMTASTSLLKKSGLAIVLFYGREKQAAYQNFNNDELNLIDCPAKIVNEIKEGYAITCQEN